jgi:aspartate carbamoyltransferase catalytic subunit
MEGAYMKGLFLYPKHLVASQQFDRVVLDALFDRVGAMEKRKPNDFQRQLQGRVVATLFYEPSTRTRLSFEAAALRLGAGVISTENAREFSSAAKGETIEDTIRVVAGYADLVIIRHYEVGAAERAAKLDVVPIINAGDGTGQHPTQALLDLYTIKKRFGYIDGLTVAMIGDLANGRTVHSLCYLLTKYKIRKIFFVAPEVVAIRQDIKDFLTRHSVDFQEESDLSKILSETDVFYQTRIQKERFGDRLDLIKQACGKYTIDLPMTRRMKSEAIIMHPLPRNDEIHPSVDSDHRVAYFEQAHNGLFVREAVLLDMLG